MTYENSLLYNEIIETKLFEFLHPSFPEFALFQLKNSTNFDILIFDSFASGKKIRFIRRGMPISFEDFFEDASPENQVKLIYHLDLFIEKNIKL